MTHIRSAIALMGLCALIACAPIAQYTPPEESGLIAVRAYPDAGSVCQVLGENEITSEFLDHTALLIGCPTSEAGAIQDRINSGAEVLDQVGAWTLLHQP
jgi:hypothetical protein